jgi:hypothetical protein
VNNAEDSVDEPSTGFARESEPEAPDGLWYKDFGSFKICGEGKLPKTFLLRGQAAKGKVI